MEAGSDGPGALRFPELGTFVWEALLGQGPLEKLRLKLSAGVPGQQLGGALAEDGPRCTVSGIAVSKGKVQCSVQETVLSAEQSMLPLAT